MVEIVVAASIFLVAIVAFVISFDTLRSLGNHTEERTMAALLLEEGNEAVLLLRDFGWDDNIATRAIGTTYHLYWDGDSYELSVTAAVIGGQYYRTVVFSPAYRDGSGFLADSGTEDPNSRRVQITISLEDGQELISAEMLVHNSYE